MRHPCSIAAIVENAAAGKAKTPIRVADTGLSPRAPLPAASRGALLLSEARMAKSNPYRPFTPNPAQMALAPPVSGNILNGLGETTPRRPRMVYWADDPDQIAHGPMQRWFYQVDPTNPHLEAARAYRAAILAAPLADLEGAPVSFAPAAWNSGLASLQSEAGFDLSGVAVMDPAWAFEGHDIKQSRIIMLAVAHDYEQIATAPQPTAAAEIFRKYGKAGAAAKTVAGWIRQHGWDAEPLTGPMTGKVAMIPPAIACGIGELGKHGSLINPEFGASFRLAAVLTDAPFSPTPPRTFGIDDFCLACQVCEAACPPEAIAPDKQTVRGVEKWYVDFDRCLPFFNENLGCSICISACPWSRPGVGLNLAAKYARRTGRG
jgi:epoxyqueuosine reductase